MDEKKVRRNEAVKRYRERVKADPEKNAIYKKKRSERAKVAREKDIEAARAKARAHYKAWKERNPEKYRDNYMRYVVKNREEINRKNLASIERRYEKLAGRPRASQCESCGDETKTVFDHNHDTGEFRGWLCSPCNKALGFLRDNPAYIRALEGYVVKDFLRKQYKKLGVEVEFSGVAYRVRQRKNVAKAVHTAISA